MCVGQSTSVQAMSGCTASSLSISYSNDGQGVWNRDEYNARIVVPYNNSLTCNFSLSVLINDSRTFVMVVLKLVYRNRIQSRKFSCSVLFRPTSMYFLILYNDILIMQTCCNVKSSEVAM